MMAGCATLKCEEKKRRREEGGEEGKGGKVEEWSSTIEGYKMIYYYREYSIERSIE